MPINKYHEALNLAINLIIDEIKHCKYPEQEAAKIFRQECILHLSDLQNSLNKISQLKQLLLELDLEDK